MVNFAQLIQTLIDRDLTQNRIAELSGTTQQTINRIFRHGLMPRYDVGCALVALERHIKYPRPRR